MSYRIDYRDSALDDLGLLKRNEPKCYKKALRLISELMEHPQTGTGHPEQLSADLNRKWSSRITKKHRLIYEIHDNEVVVIVISAYGHYSDK